MLISFMFARRLEDLYWSKRLIGLSPGEPGLDFFAGGPEYFKIIPLT